MLVTAGSPLLQSALSRIGLKSWHPLTATLLVPGYLVLGACGASQQSLDDSEMITRSVLALLASTGKPVCTDDRTNGEPLAVFREMSQAPRAARSELRWHTPLPLRPDAEVTLRDLKRAELDDQSFEIREPGPRRDALPGLDQLRLDGLAQRLSQPVGTVDERVSIRSSWIPRGVTARWWPINRARRDCRPLFEISDSVRDRTRAFVTVRSEHWGTVYALERRGAHWLVTAEWSRWLY
jgi:hypothetical protein